MQCTSKMEYLDPNKADPLNWLRDVASLRLWNISYLERSWYHVYQYLLLSLYNKRNVQFSKFRFPENKLDFCWLSRKFLNGVFLKLYPHLYSSPLVLYPPPPPSSRRQHTLLNICRVNMPDQKCLQDMRDNDFWSGVPIGRVASASRPVIGGGAAKWFVLRRVTSCWTCGGCQIRYHPSSTQSSLS